MRDWKAGIRWWVVLGLAITAVAAIACSSDESGDAEGTPDSSAAAETSADETYLATVRALSEEADRRNEEIFAALEDAPPALEVLGLLEEALPQAIEAAQSQIGELESLAAPTGYATDHDRLLRFLRDSVELLQRQLAAAEARDDLASRTLQVEFTTLQRNLLADLSQSFRDTVLVSEEAVAAGELFGGLTDEEAAYLNTVNAAYEEFNSRNAVFGQTLSRQFSDSRALLEALQGAGAGTAFEAVQNVLLPVDPPERFAADHVALLRYLAEAVRLDREIGKAIDEVDPVHFVVSNLELGNGEIAVSTAIGLSPPVLGIAFPGLSSAFQAPDPSLLADDYSGPLFTALRDFRARFGQTGPDYLAFNLGADDAFEVVARAAPGYVATVENALERVRSLVPPDNVRGDHELLIRYFEEVLQAQQDIFAAISDSDFAAISGGILRTQAAFCDAGTGISDALGPSVRVHFEGPPNDRDLARLCGVAPG